MDLSVKLFRWYRGENPALETWLPFVKRIIAVPFDPQTEAVMTLTERVTGQGADQFMITPTLFKALLRAAQKEQLEITEIELDEEATGDEEEIVHEYVRDLRANRAIDPNEWGQVAELLYRYPPRKVEAVVGVNGPGSRVVILRNGIIHSSDEQGLMALSETLKPLIHV